MKVRNYRAMIIGAAIWMSGCGSTSETFQREPISLTLGASDATIWQDAAESLKTEAPEYQVNVIASDARSRLNRITKEDGRSSVCFAPKMHVDFAGNLKGFTPLYCSALDETKPAGALNEAIENYQRGYIEWSSEMDDREFRQKVIAESTPENPICFSVLTSLFAAGNAVPVVLEENYLLACAKRIDGAASWPQIDSSVLSGWLRAEAAQLTSYNGLVVSAFRRIARDDSDEAGIYGISLEGLVELVAQKKRQAEISALRALKASDEAGMYFLSRQNADMLLMASAIAESMNSDRLTEIVNALKPKEGWPAQVVNRREMLMMKACQDTFVVPDVKPTLVSACLPWIRTSTKNSDDFEMALLLIERGIYGKPDGEPAIAPDVLDWLKYVTLSEELSELRHIFGQRVLTSQKLSDDERRVVEGF